MEKKKKNKKIIFMILIIFILIMICSSFYFINFKASKNKTINKTTTLKKVESDDWYTPTGEASKIDIYFNKTDNYPVAIKDGEENYAAKNPEYKILNTYNCDLSYCKSYGFNSSKKEVIIKDDGYVIYNYDKNEVLKLKLPNAEYNSIEFLSYENKNYGLSVSNINNMYAFYSFKEDRFTTDFMYTNIFTSESAGLAKGNISASIVENNNYDAAKYYIVSYESGEIKKESNVYLGSFGNGKNVYYYENFAEMDGYDAIIYNGSFKEVMGEEKYEAFAVTTSGNLIIKNKDENTFSIYTKDGRLVKKSKEYKQVGVVSNDYVSVIDTDDYLKIVDVDGNVVAKFIKMNDNYVFHTMLSGWYEENDKNGIYLVIENTDIEYGTLGSGLEFYYVPETKEKGVIETIGVGGYAKPVLYLYPKKNNTKISVRFEKEKLLTTTYPKYDNGWVVTANKNGDLTDLTGKYYYGLYWEETGSTKVNFDTGFYVTKENAIDFLEEKLKIIGLNERESNEFIMYWLPVLEKNKKSLVYFELTEERQRYNKLIIEPAPDSLLRVSIHVKKVDGKPKIKEQQLSSFERKGYTAIEWGGVIH